MDVRTDSHNGQKPFPAWTLPSLAYSSCKEAPKSEFPEECIPGHVAKQYVMDMRSLDESPRMNLATYVTTAMEKDAEEVFQNTWNVNAADTVQYPSCKEMENRCVAMLSNLYHAPSKSEPCGTATAGCTEACILSGLAAKKLWQQRRRARKASTEKPNLVVGAQFQVCWKKFCTYFDVEMRAVPVRENQVMDPKEVPDHVDENTVGVVCIMGSTYNGQLEDIKALDGIIEDLNKKNGWEVPILVDAAIGGFVIPFVEKELEWDFRLKNVHSIAVSGHKFGLVYPGIGWLIFRNKECLPDDMVMTTSYLGKPEPNVTINFSRNSGNIAASYYNLIRLGRMGYTEILKNLLCTAKHLADGLERTGHFRVVGTRWVVPVVAFSLLPRKGKDGKPKQRVYDEYDVMYRLREYRWMLPAYPCPKGAEDMKVLRAVIRIDVTLEMVEDLLKHIQEVLEWLDLHYGDEDVERIKKIKERFQKDDPNADMGL